MSTPSSPNSSSFPSLPTLPASSAPSTSETSRASHTVHFSHMTVRSIDYSRLTLNPTSLTPTSPHTELQPLPQDPSSEELHRLKVELSLTRERLEATTNVLHERDRSNMDLGLKRSEAMMLTERVIAENRQVKEALQQEKEQATKLQKELEAANQRLTTSENSVQEAQAQLKKVAQEKCQLESTVADEAKALSESKELVARLKADVQEKLTQQKALEKKLNQSQTHSEQQKKRYEEEERTIQEQIGKLAEQVSSAGEKLSELELSSTAAEKLLNEVTSQKTQLESDISSKQLALTEAKSQLAELTSNLTMQSEQHEKLKSDFEASERTLASLREQQQTEQEASRLQIEALNKQVSTLTTKLQEAERAQQQQMRFAPSDNSPPDHYDDGGCEGGCDDMDYGSPESPGAGASSAAGREDPPSGFQLASHLPGTDTPTETEIEQLERELAASRKRFQEIFHIEGSFNEEAELGERQTSLLARKVTLTEENQALHSDIETLDRQLESLHTEQTSRDAALQQNRIDHELRMLPTLYTGATEDTSQHVAPVYDHQHFLANDYWSQTPLPAARSIPLSHEAIFGDPTPEDTDLAEAIKTLLENKGSPQKAFNSLKKDESTLALPKWPELYEQNEWTLELLNYACLRLKLCEPSKTPLPTLQLLRTDSSAYFYFVATYVEQSFLKGKTPGQIKSNLKVASVAKPTFKVFSKNVRNWACSHVHFLHWYKTGNPMSSTEATHLLGIMNPDSHEYLYLCACYLMDSPSETKTHTPTTSTLSITAFRDIGTVIVTNANRLKKSGTCLPTCMLADNPEAEWNTDIATEVLTRAKFEYVKAQATKSASSLHFPALRQAADNNDKQTYQKTLQLIVQETSLTSTPLTRLKERIRRLQPLTLMKVKGTQCGQGSITPEKLLLSYLYYFGKEGLNNYDLPKLSHEMLALINKPVTDPKLKEIVAYLESLPAPKRKRTVPPSATSSRAKRHKK